MVRPTSDAPVLGSGALFVPVGRSVVVTVGVGVGVGVGVTVGVVVGAPVTITIFVSAHTEPDAVVP